MLKSKIEVVHQLISFLMISKSRFSKTDVAVNGLVVDSLSSIMPSDAQRKGRDIARRLREVIPRQMFEIPIQIMLGGKIIAEKASKPLERM